MTCRSPDLRCPQTFSRQRSGVGQIALEVGLQLLHAERVVCTDIEVFGHELAGHGPELPGFAGSGTACGKLVSGSDSRSEESVGTGSRLPEARAA